MGTRRCWPQRPGVKAAPIPRSRVLCCQHAGDRDRDPAHGGNKNKANTTNCRAAEGSFLPRSGRDRGKRVGSGTAAVGSRRGDVSGPMGAPREPSVGGPAAVGHGGHGSPPARQRAPRMALPSQHPLVLICLLPGQILGLWAWRMGLFENTTHEYLGTCY